MRFPPFCFRVGGVCAALLVAVGSVASVVAQAPMPAGMLAPGLTPEDPIPELNFPIRR